MGVPVAVVRAAAYNSGLRRDLREQILSRVWGYDYFGDTRTVDAHIKRIRQKLPQENVPWALKTVYGVGYRFEVNA